MSSKDSMAEVIPGTWRRTRGWRGQRGACARAPARKIGNSYPFHLQANKNIQTFSKYGVKRILTVCPHCFNTFKNEYPDFGGNYEVVHHSELIAQLVKEEKAKLTKRLGRTIVHNDSCNPS